jgi:hypothetical protein
MLALRSMVDAAMCLRNAQAPWDRFSSDKYWRANYKSMQPADQEIICRVGGFFAKAFAGRPRAQRALDVGSGANLYPALLMLPWAEQILLTDYSESNIRWLRLHVLGNDKSDAPWTWQPFWEELHELEGYNRISEPRRLLRDACSGITERAGIEQLSLFKLPQAQWQLGTMFFVAESMTEDPAEFNEAIGCFIGALQPAAPFAATFMAGSDGYPVDGIDFPALHITPDDITQSFTELGASQLSVELTRTTHKVREGYKGMIVATGIVGGR